jgi:hypothetical protein
MIQGADIMLHPRLYPRFRPVTLLVSEAAAMARQPTSLAILAGFFAVSEAISALEAVPIPAESTPLLMQLRALEKTCHDLSDRLGRIETEFLHLRATAISPSRQAANSPVDTATPAPLLAQVRNQRLALALLQLGIATRTHQPFAAELDLVRQLDMREGRLRIPIDSLSPHADTGVATVAELRDSFGVILLPKLDALGKNSDTSWTRRTWGWISAPFAATAPQSEDSVGADLTQITVRSAMDRLSEDDLLGAVRLIARLDGIPATLTARWLKEGNARIEVDSAYEVIARTVMMLLNQ